MKILPRNCRSARPGPTVVDLGTDRPTWNPNCILNLGVVVMVVLATSGACADDADQPADRSLQQYNDQLPEYDAENSLLLPENYRAWVFVGSSLGLSYSETAQPPKAERFKHVYVNQIGYREYRKTGEFPVGTMFLLEIFTKGTKINPALQGSFSQEFVGLEAAVKSGDRFGAPWTYYSFDGKDGKRLSKARRFTSDRCLSCHRKHAATDHVFTQFYPVLKRHQNE